MSTEHPLQGVSNLNSNEEEVQRLKAEKESLVSKLKTLLEKTKAIQRENNSLKEQNNALKQNENNAMKTLAHRALPRDFGAAV